MKNHDSRVEKFYLKKIYYSLFGALFFIVIAFFISRPTANNDIYNQLLASEGILSNFSFRDVGQHPVGIASVAAIFRLFNLDPLIFLYYLQPFLAGTCFVILFRILSNNLPNIYALFLALSSMSSLILIKAMNQVTAEIISLTTILILIVYIWEKIILSSKNDFKSALVIIFLSWIAISFRNVSIFIIFGIMMFLFIKNFYRNIHLFVIGFLSILPGAVKTLFFSDKVSYPGKILAWTMPAEVFNQLSKHLLNLTEIILPYSLHLNAFPLIKLFVVTICFFPLIYSIYIGKTSSEKNDKIIVLSDLFLTIGICYYGILSLANIYFDYNWGDLYRVSGFGILFILNSFWINVYVYADRWKKLAWIVLMVSFFTKIGYGIRYEMINQDSRFLFQDYRDSIAKLIRYTNGKFENIFVYSDDSWQGANLYYMLKYYDLVHTLPFGVLNYSEQVIEHPSILFCASTDIKVFETKGFSLNKIDYPRDIYSTMIE